MRGQEDPSSGQGGGSGEVPSVPSFSEEEDAEDVEEPSPLEDSVTRNRTGYTCLENDNGTMIWLQTMLRNVKVSSDSPLWPVPVWRRSVRAIKAHCRVWDAKDPFGPRPSTGWRLAYVELPLMVVDLEDGSALVCGRELDGRLPELWELSLYPLTGLVRVSQHSGGFRHYEIEDSPYVLIFRDESEGPSSSSA